MFSRGSQSRAGGPNGAAGSGHPARLPSVRTRSRLRADDTGVLAPDSRGDAASCGSHFVVPTRQSDARLVRARFVKSGQWQVCFLAARRAAGIAQHRRHPAAYRLCAMDHSGAGHPCPAPFSSDMLAPSRKCHGRPDPLRGAHPLARTSMAHSSDRSSDLKAPPAWMPAERPSAARPLSPQDAGGCRAIPRPGGPPNTSLPLSGLQQT